MENYMCPVTGHGNLGKGALLMDLYPIKNRLKVSARSKELYLADKKANLISFINRCFLKKM